MVIAVAVGCARAGHRSAHTNARAAKVDLGTRVAIVARRLNGLVDTTEHRHTHIRGTRVAIGAVGIQHQRAHTLAADARVAQGTEVVVAADRIDGYRDTPLRWVATVRRAWVIVVTCGYDAQTGAVVTGVQECAGVVVIADNIRFGRPTIWIDNWIAHQAWLAVCLGPGWDTGAANLAHQQRHAFALACDADVLGARVAVGKARGRVGRGQVLMQTTKSRLAAVCGARIAVITVQGAVALARAACASVARGTRVAVTARVADGCADTPHVTVTCDYIARAARRALNR